MKVWLKTLLLVVTLSIYIALGSMAFVLMEGNASLAGQRALRARVQRFIANHSACGVDDDAVRSLWREIRAVWSHGVLRLPVYAEVPWRDSWRFQNALVFCYTVVTTMGFGWIAPATRWGQLFCVLFAVPGIALNGYMLSVVGSACQVVWDRCSDLFGRGTSSVRSPRVRYVLGVLLTSAVLWLALILIPGAVFAELENWSFLTAQYFNFVALSTVGFGDVRPSHAALPLESHTAAGEYLYCLGVMLYFLISTAVISTVFTGVWRSHKLRLLRAVGSSKSRLVKMMRRGQSGPSFDGDGRRNEALEPERGTADVDEISEATAGVRHTSPEMIDDTRLANSEHPRFTHD